jgi:histidinol-phosphatase
MTDYSTELAFAREAARLGARVAMGHFGHNPAVHTKADGTCVTEADWAVEAQIRLRIARTWPGHNILGEEGGLTAAGGGAPHHGAPTWIIDPIDGTNNYIAAIPVWGTLVALRVENHSVVGVCHAPALNETYDAAVGMGARFNGEPMRVDPQDRIENATVIFAGAETLYEAPTEGFYRALTQRCRRSRGFGDFWGHMLVARGAAHVMAEPRVSLWDVAALEPIVTEAGGRLTDLAGAPWTTAGPCLTTNGALHDDVVALARRGSGS